MKFLVLLLLLAGCASPLPPPQYEPPPPTPTANLNQVNWLGPKPTLDDLETYIGNFRKLAFHTEWHGRWPYVKKWDGTRVCVFEGARYYKPVILTLRKLEIATGLRFRTMGAFREGCSIHFEDGHTFDGCRATFDGKIGIGAWASLEECIEEELSQTMGLYNDIPYHWTMWNDENNGEVDFLTWHDAVMLRVLYQQELYQGMPEAEAMKIVPGLIRKVILEIQ